jgi:hypothetical protein
MKSQYRHEPTASKFFALCQWKGQKKKKDLKRSFQELSHALSAGGYTVHTVKQSHMTTVITNHTFQQSSMTTAITCHTVQQSPMTTVITYHTVQQSPKL